MEDTGEGGEVCLERTVERLYESGLGVEDIARRMGVDEGWVSALISTLHLESNGE